MRDLPFSNARPARPHSTARACQGAPVVAVFFLVVAIPMLYSAFDTKDLHIAVRIGFVALAGLMIWSSLGRLWAWAAGGEARLSLPQDPVPHGQKVPIRFTLSRKMKPREWTVKVSMLGPQEEDSSIGTKWSEAFAAHQTGSDEVSATILIPPNLAPTKAGRDSGLQIAILMLKSGRMDWTFHLETQSEPGQVRQ